MSKPWKLLLFSVLCCVLLYPSTSRADEVLLTNTSGHLYGEYPLGPNQSASEDFTLNDATQLTSLGGDIYSFYGGLGPLTGSWEVTLSGPGGTYLVQSHIDVSAPWTGPAYTSLPSSLPAGSYSLGFTGGGCGNPCYGTVAGIDYYIEFGGLNFTEIGGTLAGPYGFTLTGETVSSVPEPGTWLLLGTALLGVPVQLRRRLCC